GAYVALTTTSATLSVGTIAVNAGAGQMGRDVIIAYFDPSFVPGWARRFGGAFDDTIADIDVSGADVWAVGAMRGPVMLDTHSLGASASTDSIAIHLAATDGSVTESFSAATTGADGALALAIDGSRVLVV